MVQVQYHALPFMSPYRHAQILATGEYAISSHQSNQAACRGAWPRVAGRREISSSSFVGSGVLTPMSDLDAEAEEDEEATERHELLGRTGQVVAAGGTPSKPAAALGIHVQSGELYVKKAGNYKPSCDGRCLTIHNRDKAIDLSGMAALLVLAPAGGWLATIAPALWASGFVAHLTVLLTCLATVADMAFLAGAKYTEPGILPTAVVDDADLDVDEEVAMGSNRWYDAAPAAGNGKQHRIVLFGRRYQLVQMRAKFCRETGTCIENFDHYCPWVGNAVGCRNYRFFVLFVAFANLVAVLVLTSSAMKVYFTMLKDGKQLPFAMAIALEPAASGLVIYTTVILLSVGGLLLYHVSLISSNMTTNEKMKGVFLYRRNPHHMGVAANWIAFLTPPLSHRESFVAGDWRQVHLSQAAARAATVRSMPGTSVGTSDDAHVDIEDRAPDRP